MRGIKTITKSTSSPTLSSKEFTSFPQELTPNQHSSMLKTKYIKTTNAHVEIFQLYKLNLKFKYIVTIHTSPTKTFWSSCNFINSFFSYDTGSLVKKHFGHFKMTSTHWTTLLD